MIKKILLGIAGLIVLLIIVFYAGMFLSYHFMRTPPFKDSDGNILPGSVASLEHIRLGGVGQTILIRGKNDKSPILLFLHGGPGTDEMPSVRHFNSELENHFIVVNWDQRGTGKSYSPFIPKDSMNPEQFISDGHDLIEMLCKRFHQGKIFLVGHSWGSLLGVNIAKRYPERIKAYIGIGQIVHFIDNEKVSYRFTLDMAEKENNSEALKELRALKNYPSRGGRFLADIGVERKWLIYYGGVIYGQKDYRLLYNSFFGPEENIFDLFGFSAGAISSLIVMLPQLLIMDDLMISAPELKMPVYFMEGHHDYNAPFELAEKYFKALKAPKKELLWFENSAHMPNFEEAQKFNDLMINKVLAENK